MSGCRRRLSGELSIFFALSISVILALFLSAAESARMQGARLYLTQAANSSIDSLFSQYHRQLWADYRLLGLEHYSDLQLEDEMKGFLAPYFSAGDWYPLETDSISLSSKTLLTDGGGTYFEEEVLAYMKYGIAAAVWNSNLIQQYFNHTKEANSTQRISSLYDGHAKEAAKLEACISDLSKALLEQESAYQDARRGAEAHSTARVISALKQLKKALKPVPALVKTYGKRADALRVKLEASRSQFMQECASGALSETLIDGLESDISAYESYVNADGTRRTEIENLSPRAEAAILFADQLIEEAERIQNEIDQFEASEEEASPDLDALFAPLLSKLSSYDLLKLFEPGGLGDPEKEQQLEQVSELLHLDLLTLLLPDGMVPSKEALPLEDRPSASADCSGQDTLSLSDRIYMAQYLTDVLHYYGRDAFGENPSRKGSGRLETEYVLCGADSDYENLLGLAKRLIALRSGLNLIYLYTNSAKRSDARILALQITGAFGFTPLIGVMTFFILSVWALGQALADLRDLFHGQNVPLIHNEKSFYLSLEHLLLLGSSGTLPPTASEHARSGLSYCDYLKLFLLTELSPLHEYRAMDMIQSALRGTQSDFLISRCLCALELSVCANTSHIFTRLGPVQAHRPDMPAGRYQMHVSTAYAY